MGSPQPDQNGFVHALLYVSWVLGEDYVRLRRSKPERKGESSPPRLKVIDGVFYFAEIVVFCKILHSDCSLALSVLLSSHQLKYDRPLSPRKPPSLLKFSKLATCVSDRAPLQKLALCYIARMADHPLQNYLDQIPENYRHRKLDDDHRLADIANNIPDWKTLADYLSNIKPSVDVPRIVNNNQGDFYGQT